MAARAVTVNGVELALLEDGPPDGPLALCLHGFPDTAHTWRHLLPELAGAGYHAVAPFLRGYGPSAVPADGRYQTAVLAQDVNGLHEALAGTRAGAGGRAGGGESAGGGAGEGDAGAGGGAGGGESGGAVLIGHDWGALTGYAAAIAEPARWRRLVTMAVPPPQCVVSSFFSYDQLQRSWYTFFFQSPLAEIAIPLEDYAFIDRLWADWSPGYDGRWDAARVKESLGSPERVLAAISYYRALYDPSTHDPALADVQAATIGDVPVPTLYLHGSADGCMAREVVDDPLPYLASGSEMAVVEGAGHFLHVEQPAEINRRVLEFLAR